MSDSGEGAFTVAVSEANDLFAAPLVRLDQHQNALFFLSHSWAEVDTIRPDVDEPLGAEIAPLPTIILGPPVGLPRDVFWVSFVDQSGATQPLGAAFCGAEAAGLDIDLIPVSGDQRAVRMIRIIGNKAP